MAEPIYRGINIDFEPYNFKGKEGKKNCIRDHIYYMLNRTRRIFKWSNLPDTIPERSLEIYLQSGGCCGFVEFNGSIYALSGGLGGKPDPYYMPTKFVVANPALHLEKEFKIDDECIIISNDTMYMGLIPLYRRYASAMAETELSMMMAVKNARNAALISAADDVTKKSADEYIRKIDEGELSIVGEQAFFEGVKVQPLSSTGYNNTLTNLIETEQYLKASWFNEIGLNANYNMKRESLNSAESQLNNDALLPLIDDMLKCRRIGIEKVNNKFGLNISVNLDSSWEDNQIEIDKEQDNIGGGESNAVERGIPGLED